MISAKADHIPGHWRFAREQSREMAALDWEDRIPALTSQRNFFAGIVAVILLVLLAVRLW